MLSADLDGGETLTYTSVAAGVDGRIETRRVTAADELSLRAQHRMGQRRRRSGRPFGRRHGQRRGRPRRCRSTPARSPPAPAGRGGRSESPTATRRSTSTAPMPARPSRPMSARSRSTPPTGSATSRSTTIGSPAISTTISTPPSRTAPPPASAWRRASCRSAGPSAPAMPARIRAAASSRSSRAPMSAATSSFRSARPSRSPPASAMRTSRQASTMSLRDANGVPVIDPAGRPTPDPTRPRLLTYDVSGIIYDGGIIWRPTPRTELQARAGHRYGGTTVIGSLSHQFNDDYALNATVYDSVETSGRLITNDISSLPDNFDTARDPLTGNLGGCVFGAARQRRLPRPFAPVDQRQQLPPARRQRHLLGHAPAVDLRRRRRLCQSPLLAAGRPGVRRLRRHRGRELQPVRLGRPPAEPHLQPRLQRLRQLVRQRPRRRRRGHHIGGTLELRPHLPARPAVAAGGARPLPHRRRTSTATVASALAGLRYTFW